MPRSPVSNETWATDAKGIANAKSNASEDLEKEGIISTDRELSKEACSTKRHLDLKHYKEVAQTIEGVTFWYLFKHSAMVSTRLKSAITVNRIF